MPVLEIQGDQRTAIRGTQELDAELLDEGNIEAKCGRLSHKKPYLASPVNVNQSRRRAAGVTGTMLGV